jgi:PKD repeat protein
MLRPVALLALLALAPWGGCQTRYFVPADGGSDGPLDASSGDAPQPVALDFAVTGCAQYDLSAPLCSGVAPLALSFAPVGSPSLSRFLWSFGDGTLDSSDRAPTHVYALPGRYDVTLTGAGSVGTISRTRRQLVAVAAQAIGGPCDVDGQCAGGATCVCGSGAACDVPLARGICTAPCAADPCGAGAACVDLGLSGSDHGDAGAGAGDGAAAQDGGAARDAAGGVRDAPAVDASPSLRRPLCFAACQSDGDCPADLACRDLPAGGAAAPTRWARVCFPTIPADVGAPCRDPQGRLDDTACASGWCADLGALGACTASCGPGAPCPIGSACAALGDGRNLCVRTCAAPDDCDRDPLLACESPGGAGALGFTVAGAAADTTYCAPRSCAALATCAPSGVCSGHCTRAP